ncbi:MAG: formylglycine-generating enzyme family protein [Bdellovibrionales bacterium]|nr:formylglycine-generating enzyme family protein [Bdellovibrionales bacterium]
MEPMKYGLNLLLALILFGFGAVASPNTKMAKIEGGTFTPFYDKDKNGKSISVAVKSFHLDKAPVTNRDFLEFVKKNPQWSRSATKRIFADSSYLKHWVSDFSFPKGDADRPVRYVSWFAAIEYCESLGKTLPTVQQWEYVAAADDKVKDASGKKSYQQKILHWYSRPSIDQLPKVTSGEKNVWGVYDMHGLHWEWNLDYNTALVTGESREDGSTNRNRFCGDGSLNAKDKLDYGGFMRFGFRSSLKGNYTVGNLGFRCARTKKGK